MSRRSRRLVHVARKARLLALGLVLTAAVILGDRLGLFGRRPQEDFSHYHNHTARVVHVADGDTLDVDIPDGDNARTRIRLWGVDTPETKDPRKSVQHFGPEASAFTHRVCDGQAVRLELVSGSTRDKYKRLLAYVILPDGSMLNRELVRGGYGYADPRFDHPLQEEFMRLQAEALGAHRGLWKDARPADLPYYYAGKLNLPVR